MHEKIIFISILDLLDNKILVIRISKGIKLKSEFLFSYLGK